MCRRDRIPRLVIVALAITMFVFVSVRRTHLYASEPRGAPVYEKVLRSMVWIVKDVGNGKHKSASGWVVDRENRLVLTNHHVVGNAQTVKVYFPVWQGGQLVAEKSHYLKEERPIAGLVCDSDPSKDLGLIRLLSLPAAAQQLPLAAKGVGPGQTVHSVGNPGKSQALWVYRSGTVRQVFHLHLAIQEQVYNVRVIQTQVPTNGGDSGSPLVNQRGEVVGVASNGCTNATLLNRAIDLSEIRAYLKVAVPLLNPSRASDYALQGERHLQAERLDLALSNLSRAIALDSKLAAAHALRGKVWQRMNQPEKALADFRKAIQLGSAAASVYQHRSQCYLALGDKTSALADLNQVIRLDPTRIEAHLERASVHRMLGNSKEAFADCNKVIQLNPSFGPAYYRRSLLWCAHREYDKALEDLNRAIRRAPPQRSLLAKLHTYRGELRFLKNDWHLAVVDYDLAIRFDSSWVPAHYNRGKVWYSRKRYDLAIVDFSEVIRLDPQFADSYLCRGYAWRAQREYIKARADFDTAVRLAPRLPKAHNTRAWLLATCPSAAIRNGKEAVKSATLACQLTGWKVGGYLDTLAAAHAESGNFPAAIMYQKKALQDARFARIGGKQASARLKLYEKGKAYREGDL